MSHKQTEAFWEHQKEIEDEKKVSPIRWRPIKRKLVHKLLVLARQTKDIAKGFK